MPIVYIYKNIHICVFLWVHTFMCGYSCIDVKCSACMHVCLQTGACICHSLKRVQKKTNKQCSLPRRRERHHTLWTSRRLSPEEAKTIISFDAYYAFFDFFTIGLILRKKNPEGCADLHLCENPWGEQMV